MGESVQSVVHQIHTRLADDINALTAVVRRLHAAIAKHRSQKADDRCIEDDDALYEVLGDGIKCDRRVGSKADMLANCARFIDRRCQEGTWPTYAELEAKVAALEAKPKSGTYRGPDVGVDWAGKNGFPCTCEWSYAAHGALCPEHGKQGVPVPTREEKLQAALDRVHAAAWADRNCPTCDGCGHYPAPGNPDPQGRCQGCGGSGKYRVVRGEMLARVIIALEEEGMFTTKGKG